MTTFTVNGDEHELLADTPLTYEHIVTLAGLTGNPIMVYHQSRPGGWVRSGSLHKGQTMSDMQPGTRFTVCHTGNA